MVGEDPIRLHQTSVAWIALGLTAIGVAALVANVSGDVPVSPSKVAAAAGVIVAGLWLTDRARRRLIVFLGSHGVAFERVAIYGAGTESLRIAERINHDEADSGHHLVGIFDNRLTRVTDGARSMGIAGTWDRLVDLAAEQAVDHIYICLPVAAQERLQDLMRRLIGIDIRVTYVPSDGSIAGKPIELTAAAIGGWGRFAKAVLDRLGATIGLLILSPLLLLIALAIRLDSPGPIFFRQERIGLNNRPFRIMKFRTMYGPGDDRVDIVQVRSDDPRVTRVGHVLRRFSLDELPQLFNVLKGDMSLVGPRPHPPGNMVAGRYFFDILETYAARHRVKPGITGLAQILGYRGQTDVEEKLRRRVEADLHYINNWSFLLDIEILVRTIPAVLRGRNSI